MLRFDQCWPFGSADVAHLLGTGEREVRLQGLNEPSVERWLNAGWPVTDG